MQLLSVRDREDRPNAQKYQLKSHVNDYTVTGDSAAFGMTVYEPANSFTN